MLNYQSNKSNLIVVPPEECATSNIHHLQEETYSEIKKLKKVVGYSGQ